MAMLMACPTFLKGNIVTAMRRGYTCPHFHLDGGKYCTCMQEQWSQFEDDANDVMHIAIDLFKQQVKLWMKKETLVSK